MPWVIDAIAKDPKALTPVRALLEYGIFDTRESAENFIKGGKVVCGENHRLGVAPTAPCLGVKLRKYP